MEGSRNSTLRLTALSLLAIATVTVGNANADEKQPEGKVRFTGPLVSGGPPLPKGRFNVEPYLIQTQTVGYYDQDGHRHDTDDVADNWRIVVPVQYGATERLTLGATLNAIYAHDHDEQRHWTAGDTRLSAWWRLAQGQGPNSPVLTLALHQNLSTGQHDRLDQRRIPSATGSGADSTTIALSGQSYFLPRRNLRGRAGVSWRLPGADAGIHGESAYRTTSEFEGHAELGSGAQANVGVEYSFNPTWVAAADLVYEYEHDTRVRGHVSTGQTSVEVDQRLPSSWRVSVAPAVEYHWSDHAGLIVGALVSLDGRNSAAVVAPQAAVNISF